jgi:hypothetical protein
MAISGQLMSRSPAAASCATTPREFRLAWELFQRRLRVFNQANAAWSLTFA